MIGAIIVSRAADLAGHGVAVLGPVPRGLPHLGLPALGWHDATALLGTAVSMFVVILAQSAATSRAYAAKYEETFSEDTDLVGLGAANVAAAFSGTFVVNGSPTKTQMADSAGGRSQLTQLTTSAVVLIVLLLLTGPLAYLPIAALAAVVFLIAVELVDVTGMRRILACPRHEFAIALLTAAAVVVLGVQDGIVLAVVASIIDHLRHSYRPLNSVLVKSPAGHWQPVPVLPGARTEEGLVVYRFGTSLYYANASRLIDDVTALAGREARCGGWFSTARPSATSTTPRRRSSPGSSTPPQTTHPLRRQQPSSARSASSSTATASAPPSAPAPTTTPPARRSRPSTPRKRPAPSKHAHARQPGAGHHPDRRLARYIELDFPTW